MKYAYFLIGMAALAVAESASAQDYPQTQNPSSESFSAEAPEPTSPDPTLVEFARASCLFWYFQENNYDLKDIKLISGGLVETGGLPLEKYIEVSALVRDYRPPFTPDNDADIALYKCFYMSQDEKFQQILVDISTE